MFIIVLRRVAGSFVFVAALSPMTMNILDIAFHTNHNVAVMIHMAKAEELSFAAVKDHPE